MDCLVMNWQLNRHNKDKSMFTRFVQGCVLDVCEKCVKGG